MTGQDAVNTAKAFNERIDYDGVVLTKLDGDARGGAVMPWHHQLDFKFAQNFYLKVGGQKNTLQFGIDIKNLANLLNHSWGLYKTVNNTSLLKYKDGSFQFQRN